MNYFGVLINRLYSFKWFLFSSRYNDGRCFILWLIYQLIMSLFSIRCSYFCALLHKYLLHSCLECAYIIYKNKNPINKDAPICQVFILEKHNSVTVRNYYVSVGWRRTFLIIVLLLFLIIVTVPPCKQRKHQISWMSMSVHHTFRGVETNAALLGTVQDQRRTAETVEWPSCIHARSVLAGVSRFTLIII